jgi:Trp operon repressor
MYCAVIGDIIRSKEIKKRLATQEKLEKTLHKINHKYGGCIASNFAITLGDEFQGLLEDTGNLISIIETIKFELYPVKIRFGVGIGQIFTRIDKNVPLGADGPAYHNARKMIDDIKKIEKSKMRHTVDIKIFSDNSISSEDLINVSLSLCSFMENRWTQRQREIIYEFLMHEDNQSSIAEKLGVTQSTIQRSLKSSGFYNYLYARKEIQKHLDKIFMCKGD